MLEFFPFGRTGEYLEFEDFHLFANSYRQLVTARIPSSGDVLFIGVDDALPKLSSDPRKGTEISKAIESMLRGELICQLVADNVLLAFQLEDDRYFVIVVSLVDPMVVQRGAPDWLEDTRDNLLREFIMVKRAYRDPETGVLNSAHMFTVLQSQSTDQELAVVLVELPSRSRVLRVAFRNAQRAAAALVSFTDNRFLVHHLGQCVFALLATADAIASIEDFSSSLVQYLKKENFYKVHIGSSSQGIDGSPGTKVLDQAWTSLQAASRRGPFSFCDFSVFANASHHPLRPASAEILKKYKRVSRQDDCYCLLSFNRPDTPDTVSETLQSLELPENALVLGSDNGCLIYLPGYSGTDGLLFAKTLLDTLVTIPGMSEVYAGVSAFPYKEFSKAETLENARKAQLHAAFFGAGQAVLFDAVSLNVSGDIYFSDGDLPKAVREYRLGLGCDPQDVNLFNSLGVAYALLNKTALARSTFESALEIDAENYMAYYNLGLGAQLRGDIQGALASFEKAYSYCSKNKEDLMFRRDLKVQLGQLYCQAGNYEQSLKFLEEWRDEVSARQQGRILKYLGEAYLGIGNPSEAMLWLQRAHRRNEFDHEILSLLGTAIWQAREGDDIALSLCGKSVDLAPENSQLRVRLARVQLHVGQYEQALVNLGKCRGQSVNIDEVQLLKATLYERLKQGTRVKYWAHKVQERCGVNSEPYRKAQVLLDSIQ